MQVDLIQPIENSLLIAQLAALGVHPLRGLTVPTDRRPVATSNLIAALARHPEPRFREALIPLFLRQPHLSEQVPSIIGALDVAAVDVVRHMYTAAVYLQRLWRGTLGLYLGRFPLLPDYFGEIYYGLPAPDEYFGELGLRDLADYYRKRTGYDWRSLYASVIALFLKQLSLDRTRNVHSIR